MPSNKASLVQNNQSEFMNFTAKSDKYSSTDYNIVGLTYPEDLVSYDNEGRNRYGDNKVVFYINVSTDSKLLKSKEKSVETVTNVQRDFRSSIVGKNFSIGEITGGAATVGALGGAAASVISDVKNISGALKAAVGGAAGAGAAAFGLGALTATNPNNQESNPNEQKQPSFTRPQSRLKAAIALYIPNNLVARYSASWGDEDTAAFAMAGEIGRAYGSSASLEGILNNLSGLAKDVVSAIAIEKAPLGGAVGVATGIAPNPKKEQAFKNIDFRTFTFDYQFAPKSSNEAQNVLNIIRLFKYHMHPEFKDSTGFLYTYPSEFDIVYYKGENENLNIHRHTSCVLVEMTVNYSPNGVFSTFPDGMPTQISLTLTFRELMLLTKESIDRGA